MASATKNLTKGSDMTVATTSHATTETEALLLSLPKSASIRINQYAKDLEFFATAYVNDDVLNDHCSGKGPTLAAAIDNLMHALDLAKTNGPVLKSAREVKSAVVKLIAEHKAAPASFRAAIDGLRVEGY